VKSEAVAYVTYLNIGDSLFGERRVDVVGEGTFPSMFEKSKIL
jgi:hypothetical protein